MRDLVGASLAAGPSGLPAPFLGTGSNETKERRPDCEDNPLLSAGTLRVAALLWRPVPPLAHGLGDATPQDMT